MCLDGVGCCKTSFLQMDCIVGSLIVNIILKFLIQIDIFFFLSFLTLRYKIYINLIYILEVVKVGKLHGIKKINLCRQLKCKIIFY
jgi:hypothetical protein